MTRLGWYSCKESSAGRSWERYQNAPTALPATRTVRTPTTSSVIFHHGHSRDGGRSSTNRSLDGIQADSDEAYVRRDMRTPYNATPQNSRVRRLPDSHPMRVEGVACARQFTSGIVSSGACTERRLFFD